MNIELILVQGSVAVMGFRSPRRPMDSMVGDQLQLQKMTGLW